MLRDESQAQDAVQDVFLSLIKNTSNLKDEFPSSLLYRMATNTCLNMLKRAQKESRKDDTFFNNIEGSDDFSERLEARELLARIFVDEKSDTIALAVMRYIDKLTYEEIAELLDLSVSGVRKRLRKLSEKAQKFKVALDE